MASSTLVQRIVSELRQKIQLGELSPGAHLSAQKVADSFQVSRSPAREALTALAEQALLEQIPNRGYFVLAMPDEPTLRSDEVTADEEPLEYYQLSEDWLNDAIPAEVTEKYLRERYQLTKFQVIDILNRAAKVGWAEPKPGYGWRFLEVAKTPEALEQIYRVRSLIEPAALLETTFNYDRDVLGRLKKEQVDLLAGGIDTLPADRLLKSGIRFHEELIKLSGNPLYLMILRQLNNMRRLIEYRSMIDRKRQYTQCAEHLRMVELVEAGDNLEAAHLMKRHLSGSLARKSPILQRRRIPDGQPERTLEV
ncbi:GntR family transcriptional regulator [Pseudomonas sp. 22-AL-CL-001]|uniref:GntR family transcriptional regulator n=1 Tax=Pseudomonas alabamensis TaxID=3064349 RepID=UPI0027131E30|nr:GntR family transcriptional regulator [Pseudomonas sp. 22-AL-CL-001]MDO7911202.1 GntR family transcriptional regulator [Pseudomonas sp. 22-AL-CL-001]